MKRQMLVSSLLGLNLCCEGISAQSRRLSKSYLSGTWECNVQNSVMTLEFENDGSYVYGNNDASKPKVFRVDENLDARLQQFNVWWEVGDYTIINNVIRKTPSDFDGPSGAVIGKTVDWIVTIISDDEMVVGDRTYKKR